MSKTLPNSTKEEKYRWIKPIPDKEITIKQMAKACPFSERTLKYWLANYRQGGLKGLTNKSARPKSHPGETSGMTCDVVQSAGKGLVLLLSTKTKPAPPNSTRLFI